MKPERGVEVEVQYAQGVVDIEKSPWTIDNPSAVVVGINQWSMTLNAPLEVEIPGAGTPENSLADLLGSFYRPDVHATSLQE